MYEELTPSSSLARGNGSAAAGGNSHQRHQLGAFPKKPSAEVLRRDLETELKLDNSDIRSYAWYHGRLPRDVAEELTRDDGDFLIRESVSSPGEYVLTLRWSTVLHFKINQELHQQGSLPPKRHFQFEQESFESIPALIMHHFGKSIPISIHSGAVIRRPINRSVPLSFSDAKYASLRRKNGSLKSGGAVFSQPYSHSTSLSSSSLSSESSSSNPEYDPRIHSNHLLHRSPDHLQRLTTDPLPVVPNPVLLAPKSPHGEHFAPGPHLSSSPKPFPLKIPNQQDVPDGGFAQLSVPSNQQRPSSQIDLGVASHGMQVGRAGSEPQLSPTKTRPPENDTIGPLPAKRGASSRGGRARGDLPQDGAVAVPPKPSRVPSFRRPVIRHRDGSKSAGNSPAVKAGHVNQQGAHAAQQQREIPSSSMLKRGESLSEPSTPQPAQQTGTTPLEAHQQQAARLRNSVEVTSLLKGGSDVGRRQSVTKTQTSSFDIKSFVSTLLPAENKPVEGAVMVEVKNILLGTDPFKLARHMTAIDCQVCRIENNGLRDMLLSKGAQLRKDIMERHQCTAFWVAVSVLRGCTSLEERVDMLNVFIQVANELVHSLGNVFGFSALMAGLSCPQLGEMRELWSSLQRRYTNNSVTLEKKLRPLLKFLDEGRGQINLVSSCIPHILPILRFYESPLPGIPHNAPKPPTVKQLSASEGDILGSVASAGSPGTASGAHEWWQNLPDDSFDSLMAQLKASRTVLSSLPEFSRNAKSKLHDFETTTKLREVFATEFHLRLLWGAKGVEVARNERYQKFDRVITLMAKRLTS